MPLTARLSKPRPPMAKFADFSYCSNPDDCELIEARFCLSLPHSFPSFHSQDESADAALAAVLSPDWDGARSPKGQAFITATLLTACPYFIDAYTAGIAPGPERLAQISESIGRLTSWPKGGAAFRKLINKSLLAIRETRGCFGRRGDPESARAILMALVHAASPPDRAHLAKSLLPPWQRACEVASMRDPDLFADAYGACLAAGSSVNEVFGFAPKEGASVSEQLKAALERLPEGPIRSVLFSGFERETLALKRSCAPPAFEAQGLSSERLGALLSAVAALEAALPGRGPEAAVEWLLAHPALPASAPSEPLGPSEPPSARHHRL